MKQKREDLKLRDYAIKKGWTVIYSQADLAYNRTGLTLEDCPHNTIIFSKKNKRVWYCRLGWMAADIKGGRYLNHRVYEVLKDAIDSENSRYRKSKIELNTKKG